MRGMSSLWRAATVSAALTLAMLAHPALAHHSFSMFDPKRELTLTGTVKEFQWTNPHVFIQLLVQTDASMREWSIEMTSPSHLIRNGWKPSTVKAGARITVKVRPMRDGRAGGWYVSAVDADGKPLGRFVETSRGSAP